MSYDFTVYDAATGLITSRKTVQDESEVEMNTPEGKVAVPGHWNAVTHYGENGEILPRPSVPVMTGSTYDLNQLPTESVLIVKDEWGHVTEVPAQDETLELTDAGTYKVRSETPFPWIDFVTEVTVA